ncbi:unnamed protein product [Arctogadus glacialis]
MITVLDLDSPSPSVGNTIFTVCGLTGKSSCKAEELEQSWTCRFWSNDSSCCSLGANTKCNGGMALLQRCWKITA